MITTFSYSLSTILGVLNCDPTLQLNGRGKVQTISTSSLECQMGTLFVPLKDIRDGHNFIPDALNRGASFFLCENKHPILKTLSIEDQKKAILVEDTLLALGELAKFHRNAFRPIVIAITGSSGKTSTKDLIGNLFSFLPNNQIVITEKNYNTSGNKILPLKKYLLYLYFIILLNLSIRIGVGGIRTLGSLTTTHH